MKSWVNRNVVGAPHPTLSLAVDLRTTPVYIDVLLALEWPPAGATNTFDADRVLKSKAGSDSGRLKSYLLWVLLSIRQWLPCLCGICRKFRRKGIHADMIHGQSVRYPRITT